MEILETIKNLKDLAALGGASDEQISNAQSLIGVKFADEFVQYVKGFGALSAYGFELFGVSEHARLDTAKVTLEQRELNSALPDDMYVIEDLGIDGILILQNEKGEIFELAPNTKPNKIFDSLSDYLSSKS